MLRSTWRPSRSEPSSPMRRFLGSRWMSCAAWCAAGTLSTGSFGFTAVDVGMICGCRCHARHEVHVRRAWGGGCARRRVFGSSITCPRWAIGSGYVHLHGLVTDDARRRERVEPASDARVARAGERGGHSRLQRLGLDVARPLARHRVHAGERTGIAVDRAHGRTCDCFWCACARSRAYRSRVG